MFTKIFLGLMFFLINFSTLLASGVDEIKTTQGGVGVIQKLLNIESILGVLINIGLAVGIIIATSFATRFIPKIIENKIHDILESKLEPGEEINNSIILVVTKTLKLLLWTIGFSLALGVIGIQIGFFMGGIGIGLGFTLQLFATNFLSGIILLVNRVIKVGDLLKLDGEISKVLEVNTLFAKTKTFDGVIKYIPNQKFLQTNLLNYSVNNIRRVVIEVRVDFNTDIVKAKSILMKILKTFPEILEEPKSKVLLTGFQDSAIGLKVIAWIDRKKTSIFEIKSNLTETINLGFKQTGIQIPYSQITISNRND